MELGLTLIERTPKGIVFTPEGESLICRIRRLLSEYNDILTEANELSHRTNYTLRLGIASILSSDIFPLIYKDFLVNHKDFTIRLDEDSAYGQIKKLLNEELDLAFNGLPEDLDNNEFRAIPVCRREIKLIMHPDHPLAQFNTISVEQLNKIDVSIFSSSGVMGQVLEKAFLEREVHPNVISEHSQIHGMIEIVSTCCSVGFLNLAPETTSMSKNEDIVLRSFEEPLTFMVGFMMKKRKYIPPICQEFVDFISKKLGGEDSAVP